jgi:queuosine precursor transporter
MPAVVLIGLYLAAIVIANLVVALFGPKYILLTSFLLIGLDLVARDRLHDMWAGKALWPRMLALIGAGSLLSAAISIVAEALTRGAGVAQATIRVAVASFVAFALAGLADAAIYHAARRHPWLVRANTSNLAGAAVDSLVFPTLAFGSLMPLIIAGQFAAKVAGGALWSLVLGRRRQQSKEFAGGTGA